MGEVILLRRRDHDPEVPVTFLAGIRHATWSEPTRTLWLVAGIAFALGLLLGWGLAAPTGLQCALMGG